MQSQPFRTGRPRPSSPTAHYKTTADRQGCRVRSGILGLIAVVLWPFAAAGATPSNHDEPTVSFHSAQPVWPAGRETEKNLTVGFRAVFVRPGSEYVRLRITGSTLYRIHLNNQFVGQGPARGPQGWFRVDEWDLQPYLRPGQNLLAIEVAGYNVNSYYVLNQPSFLQAEVVTEGRVLASTAGEGVPLAATLLTERVQRVQRYSFQRPFSEVYRLKPGCNRWREEVAGTLESLPCAIQPAVHFLPRRVPYPDFACRQPVEHVARGRLAASPPQGPLWKDRSLTGIGPKLGGYPETELEIIPSLDLQKITNASLQSVNTPWDAASVLSLEDSDFEIVDLGANLTGFIGLRIRCAAKTRLALTFDEILSNGEVDFKRLGCVNIIQYDLEPGDYTLESFEPYTLRFLKLMMLKGAGRIEQVYLRELVNPEVWAAQFAASDERLNRLFAAGRETFRQNAVDLFMDCPSRERAGWLCDSFFTARTANDLSGHPRIEQNFLENYLLPQRFEFIPEGMLPMCYPADHNDGVFIPNWSLWFVVQLEEYLARGGDRSLVEALRPRVLRLFDYFRRFQNRDGLLEKLESWVFVEWSKANDFVQDVNYPSNMLYAEALAVAGRLYGLPELTQQAERIRDLIRRQAFDGRFFIDNALRREGRLQVTTNHSEVAQYFAFFFHVVSPESHPQLWTVLRQDFGPQRRQTKAFPEVHPANAFVGNVLRLELLSRYGQGQQMLDESIAYLLYMADRTGTLWENDGAYASCNHGFASHAVHVLYRDVLGLQQIDPAQRKVNLRFANLKLDWCEGSVPVAGGRISVRWWKDLTGMSYQVNAPAGYTLQVTTPADRSWTRRP